MRLSKFAILLTISSSEIFAQGVYIPPRTKKPEPTIVTMSIGDNVVPLIELGDNGPTIVTFPGKIINILKQDEAYDWEAVGTTEIKATDGNEQLLSKIVFSRSKKLTPQLKSFLREPNHFITVVAIYRYGDKTYTHDVDLIWRPEARRSSVVLLPTVDGIPKDAMIDAFKREYAVPKGDDSFERAPVLRRVSGRKSQSEPNTLPDSKIFKDHGFLYKGGTL